jgi:hypothetical protein
MHSPALTIGWELWARHRWGLSAIGAGALVAAVLVQVLPDGPVARLLGNLSPAWVLFVYLYLVSIFVYGESTLGGKAVGFPPRLFTLPLRTSKLVAWPMLYGTLSAAGLWLWLSALILVPCGRAPTVTWWPALLLAANLACTQAVCWTLVRAPLLRLVVVILGLPSIVLAAVLVWAKYNLEVTLGQVTLGLCAVIGTAYAVAVVGVARDRRGDWLGWAWLGQLLLKAVPRLPPSPYPLPRRCREPSGTAGPARLAGPTPREEDRVRGRERSSASPLRCQRWLEVRRHAWLLPAFVGFFLALLFWATALPLDPVEVAHVVAAIVGFPAVLAFFVGFGMGKTSFWARDLQLSSFIATRPLSCAALARAKLHAAGLSALAAWGLVVLLAPLWVVASGNVEVVRALADVLFRGQPAWKLSLLAPLALAELVGLTWLQIVAGMCLSLTGRVWVVNAVVLLYGAIGTALASLVIWAGFHPDFFDTLLLVLGWLGVGLGLLKLSAAAWVWRWSGRRQGTGAWLTLWLAIAACLLVPLYALVPENPVPTHLVALYVVLALPLSRLIGLPAAVAWNRHR